MLIISLELWSVIITFKVMSGHMLNDTWEFLQSSFKKFDFHILLTQLQHKKVAEVEHCHDHGST